jgi:serpin B
MSRTVTLPILSALLIMAVGCDTPDSSTKQPQPSPTGSGGSSSTIENADHDTPSNQDDAPRPDASSSPSSSTTSMTTPFGLALIGHLDAGDDDNPVISPYSLAAALGMLTAGAKGDTRRQLLQALHVEGDDGNDSVASSFADLRAKLLDDRADEEKGERLRDAGTRPTLKVANALWLQADFTPLPAYADTLTDAFDATIDTVDFGAADDAADTINTWVADRTSQMITDLMSPDMFTPQTRLVVTNAVYFQGSWLNPFDTNNTEPETFRTASGEKISIPTMHRTDTMQYVAPKQAAARGVELPYAGGNFSLALFLPDEGKRAAFANQLDADRLDDWLTSTQRRRVALALPRCKVGFELRARHALEQLGITDAFAPNQADFSGIHESAELYVDAVIHKTQLSIHESGTEAAAASGGAIGITGGVVDAEPITFQLDRPFFVALRHIPTETMLFGGWINRPE